MEGKNDHVISKGPFGFESISVVVRLSSIVVAGQNSRSTVVIMRQDSKQSTGE
jgi:hypothetical protein